MQHIELGFFFLPSVSISVTPWFHGAENVKTVLNPILLLTTA